MGFTDALETSLLEHIFKGVTYTKPTTWYVGLSTTTPLDDGSNFTEPVGNGYARVAITCNGTNWDFIPGTTTLQNLLLVTFPQATPAGWGTIIYVGLFTALSGGSPLITGMIKTPILIASGQTYSIAANTLLFEID